MLAAAWLTAVGTLAVAIAAVGVALWTERRAATRLTAEHERADRQLTDERAHSNEQLASQQAFSREQLAAEQARSRVQIDEERGLARQREQLAEAYRVQVVQVESRPDPSIKTTAPPRQTNDARVLAAMVVNRGTYTITRVGAQFRLSADGTPSLVGPGESEWMSGFELLDKTLRVGVDGPPAHPPHLKRLAPWDTGIRFRTDPIGTSHIFGWYPVVRWTDRWGNRWEHKLGDVRRVEDTAAWEPT